MICEIRIDWIRVKERAIQVPKFTGKMFGILSFALLIGRVGEKIQFQEDSDFAISFFRLSKWSIAVDNGKRGEVSLPNLITRLAMPHPLN